MRNLFAPRWRVSLVACLAIAVGATWSPLQQEVEAQVTGISYTLTPVVEGINFNEEAALKSGLLYGGRLGFGFGEFIELNGLYLYGNNLDTDFGGLSGFDEVTTDLLDALPSRTTDLQRFGGEIKFNIGRGFLFPFVTLGTGVLRFDPEGLNHSKAIYLSEALGIQYSYENRFALVAEVSNLSYRYNPAATLLSTADIASVGLTPADFERVTVNNLSGNVGVKFYLGGWPRGELSEFDRALYDQLRGGLWGAFRLEPSAGEISFTEPLGFRDDQRMLCLSAGIDLGAYAGLRGFYWRGAKDDSWTEFDDLQAYGGELKLAFTDIGGGLTPYVTVGGGYMDVMDDYVGNGVAVPEDYPFALGGIGVVLPLGNAVSVDACLRSVLMSTAGVENVTEPGDVESSTMFTVGISFGLGVGRGKTPGTVFGREIAESRAERERLASDVGRVDSEIVRLQEELDSLTSDLAEQRRQDMEEIAALRVELAERAASVEEPFAEIPAAEIRREPKPVKPEAPVAAVEKVPAPPAETRAPREPRWMNVPVPEEGEIYVRFGAPGGVSVETVEGAPIVYYFDPATGTIIPAAPEAAAIPGQAPVAPAQPAPGVAPTPGAAYQAVPSAPAAPAAPGLTSEQVEDIVRRVVREERPTAAAPQIAAPQPGLAEVEAAPAGVAPSDEASMRRLETTLDTRLRGIETQLAELRQAGAVPARPLAQQMPTQPVVVQTPQPAEPTTTIVTPSAGPVALPEPTVRLVGMAPVTGYNLDEPKQGLLGIRADFLHKERPFRLVPELVLGFGDDVTTNVNLNGIYDAGFAVLDYMYPYGGIGLGLLKRDDLEMVFNLVIGTDVRVERHTVFVEYLNQDFFDNNRLLAGYRFSF